MSQATPMRSIANGIIRMSAPKPKDYTALYYIIAASARNSLSSALSKNRSYNFALRRFQKKLRKPNAGKAIYQ